MKFRAMPMIEGSLYAISQIGTTSGWPSSTAVMIRCFPFTSLPPAPSPRGLLRHSPPILPLPGGNGSVPLLGARPNPARSPRDEAIAPRLLRPQPDLLTTLHSEGAPEIDEHRPPSLETARRGCKPRCPLVSVDHQPQRFVYPGRRHSWRPHRRSRTPELHLALEVNR
jgi:hypothetical protein